MKRKSNTNGELKTRRFLYGLMVAIGLMIWVWLCIFLSQLIFFFIFKWLVSVFKIYPNTIIESLYSTIVYIFAIVIMLGIPALLRKKFKRLENHPMLEKASREELSEIMRKHLRRPYSRLQANSFHHRPDIASVKGFFIFIDKHSAALYSVFL